MSDSTVLEAFAEHLLSSEEGTIGTEDLVRALVERVQQDCSDVDYVLHMFAAQMIHMQQKLSGADVEVTLAFQGDRVNAKQKSEATNDN